MLIPVDYILDVPRRTEEFREAVPDFPEDPEIAEFLKSRTTINSAMWGLFGATFFDMASSEMLTYDRSQQKDVALQAHRIFLLEDIVDTRIDTLPIPLEDKLSYLDEGLAALLGHGIPEDVNPEKYDIRYRASFALAALLREQFLSKDKAGLIEPVFTEMVEAAKEQLVTTDPEALLEICKTIGAACVDSTAVLVEIATQNTHPQIRRAAAALGEYGGLLDHLYEVDNDLEEGANTYATIMIGRYGDTPATRRFIKRRMLNEARESINRGTQCLQDEQLKPYFALKHMTDLKFRVLEQSKQFIKRIRSRQPLKKSLS